MIQVVEGRKITHAEAVAEQVAAIRLSMRMMEAGASLFIDIENPLTVVTSRGKVKS